MMYNVTALAVALSLVAATSLHADAPEFDRLQESYRSAVLRVTKPLQQSYIAELQKLRDALARDANLDAANKVQAEIDAVYQAIAFANTAATVTLAGKATPQAIAVGNAQEIQVSIPANEVNGYKIGPLKKGVVITLTYVGGSWKPDGKVASDRPDAEKPERGEKSRLAIASGRYKTQAGPVLAVVPAGTATNPFSYTLEADVENVVLRINEDGNDFADNPGAVTYRLKIAR